MLVFDNNYLFFFAQLGSVYAITILQFILQAIMTGTEVQGAYCTLRGHYDSTNTFTHVPEDIHTIEWICEGPHP